MAYNIKTYRNNITKYELINTAMSLNIKVLLSSVWHVVSLDMDPFIQILSLL